jgi:SAM-dependent methyltransferase
MKQTKHAYRGRHADLYDVFYASKPYAQEAEFVHGCIEHYREKDAGKRLLELACGTAGHAVHFARRGYEITAVDHSPDMLSRAKEKAARQGLQIDFHQLDMRDLSSLPDSYDVVTCLFDSIGYVQTDEALSAVFSGINARLRTGGLFIFEFWHAPPMLKSHDPLRVKRFPFQGGTIVRISETTLHQEHSLADVTYSIYDLRDDGTFEAIVETQTNRFFTLSEIKTWASLHGFAHRTFHAGFHADTGITHQTWHVLAVWQKK